MVSDKTVRNALEFIQVYKQNRFREIVCFHYLLKLYFGFKTFWKIPYFDIRGVWLLKWNLQISPYYDNFFPFLTKRQQSKIEVLHCSVKKIKQVLKQVERNLHVWKLVTHVVWRITLLCRIANTNYSISFSFLFSHFLESSSKHPISRFARISQHQVSSDNTVSW